jgi:hypothetical protein
MHTLMITGTVPDYHGAEFLLPVDNDNEFNEWLKKNRIKTKITYVDNRPTVKIRGELAAQCHPRRKIRYTVDCIYTEGARLAFTA